MKEEIFELAKKLRFESHILGNKPWKYSNKEDLRWFLWLTEAQQWLRNNHSLNIFTSYKPNIKNGIFWYMI